MSRWRGACVLAIAAGCSANERPEPASAPVVVATAPGDVAIVRPVDAAAASADAGVPVDASGLTPGYGEGYYPPEAYGTLDREPANPRPERRPRRYPVPDAGRFICDGDFPTFD